MIVGKHDNTSTPQFDLIIQADEDIRILYYSGGGSNPVYFDSTASLSGKTWHHVVGQKVGSSFEIWIDGSSESGTTSGTHGAMDATGSALEIGRRGLTTQHDYMDGQIRDVRIYGTSLSAAQVQYQHTLGVSGTAPPTPVGEWKLNEGTGTTATDTGSGAHNGTLTGGVAWFELLVEGWELNEGTGSTAAASVNSPTNDGTISVGVGWS